MPLSSTPPTAGPARILILAPPTDTWWGNALVMGISAQPLIERRITMRWVLPPPQALRDLLAQPWDGIITHAHPQVLPLLPARVPTVITATAVLDDPRVVAIDESAVGRLAAAHLMDTGLTSYAWCGGGPGPLPRRDAFLAALARTVPCHTSPPEATPEQADTTLRLWLAGLPRPTAVACWGDWEALRVALAAQDLGLRVPEDLAILGANDDPAICPLAPWPLSSIRVPHRQVGQVAAQRLDRLLLGERLSPGPVLIPPDGVTVRRSTDLLAIADPLTTAALHYLRANAHLPLRVATVARAIGTTPRTLADHCERHLGYGVLEAIHRARLDRAQRLLLERPDLTLAHIALKCGCASALALNRLFRQYLGTTPGAWQRLHLRPGR